MDRTQILMDLRPNLGLDITVSTDEEKFQNTVLRPILKFQNDILQVYFLNAALANKPNFAKEEPNDRRNFVVQKLSKDAIIRNTMLGMVVALMTSEEMLIYQNDESMYKRRIISMLVDRLLS